MSNTLPWRTLATPSTPSDFNAPSMALPCGSRMPDFRVTVTRAFTFASAFDQHRTRARWPLVFHQDAQTLGDLGIGLQQSAEIPAEAILVELLVRLDVPQPARVGGDLVGDDDPHHLVLEQAAAFHLEIHQAHADAPKPPGTKGLAADRQPHDIVNVP